MTGIVFISYSRDDRGYVERLATHLTDANIKVWYDRNLTYGHAWVHAIEDQIEACSVFVPIMSAASTKRSCWVGKETLLAQKRNKNILPISRDGAFLFPLIDLQAEIVTDDAMPSADFVVAVRKGGQVIGGGDPGTQQTGFKHPDLKLTIRGHTGHVRSVAFAPDGSVVASAGEDDQVQIWDPATGNPVGTIRDELAPSWPLKFMPGPNRLVAATSSNSPGVHIWAVDGGRLVRSLAEDPVYGDEISTMAISPDGRLLATGDNDGAVLWKLDTGESMGRLSAGKAAPRWPLAFSPDSSRLAIAHKGATAGIWDLTTRRLEQGLYRHKQLVTTGAYSSDGSYFVTGSSDATARIWDAASGEQTQVLAGHTKAIWAIGFTSEGRRVVSASSDKSIRIWDAKTGESLKKLTGHTGGVYAIAFSPDGRLLASGGGDGTVRIWKLE